MYGSVHLSHLCFVIVIKMTKIERSKSTLCPNNKSGILLHVFEFLKSNI